MKKIIFFVFCYFIVTIQFNAQEWAVDQFSSLIESGVEKINTKAKNNDLEGALYELESLNETFRRHNSEFPDIFQKARENNSDYKFKVEAKLAPQFDIDYWRNMLKRVEKNKKRLNEAFRGIEAMETLDQQDVVWSYLKTIYNAGKAIKDVVEKTVEGNLFGVFFDTKEGLDQFIEDYKKMENAELQGLETALKEQELKLMISKAKATQRNYERILEKLKYGQGEISIYNSYINDFIQMANEIIDNERYLTNWNEKRYNFLSEDYLNQINQEKDRLENSYINWESFKNSFLRISNKAVQEKNEIIKAIEETGDAALKEVKKVDAETAYKEFNKTSVEIYQVLEQQYGETITEKINLNYQIEGFKPVAYPTGENIESGSTGEVLNISSVLAEREVQELVNLVYTEVKEVNELANRKQMEMAVNRLKDLNRRFERDLSFSFADNYRKAREDNPEFTVRINAQLSGNFKGAYWENSLKQNAAKLTDLRNRYYATPISNAKRYWEITYALCKSAYDMAQVPTDVAEELEESGKKAAWDKLEEGTDGIKDDFKKIEKAFQIEYNTPENKAAIEALMKKVAITADALESLASYMKVNEEEATRFYSLVDRFNNMKKQVESGPNKLISSDDARYNFDESTFYKRAIQLVNEFKEGTLSWNEFDQKISQLNLEAEQQKDEVIKNIKASDDLESKKQQAINTETIDWDYYNSFAIEEHGKCYELNEQTEKTSDLNEDKVAEETTNVSINENTQITANDRVLNIQSLSIEPAYGLTPGLQAKVRFSAKWEGSFMERAQIKILIGNEVVLDEILAFRNNMGDFLSEFTKTIVIPKHLKGMEHSLSLHFLRDPKFFNKSIKVKCNPKTITIFVGKSKNQTSDEKDENEATISSVSEPTQKTTDDTSNQESNSLATPPGTRKPNSLYHGRWVGEQLGRDEYHFDQNGSNVEIYSIGTGQIVNGVLICKRPPNGDEYDFGRDYQFKLLGDGFTMEVKYLSFGNKYKTKKLKYWGMPKLQGADAEVIDNDMDSVPNNLDKCPNTTRGHTVDNGGVDIAGCETGQERSVENLSIINNENSQTSSETNNINIEKPLTKESEPKNNNELIQTEDVNTAVNLNTTNGAEKDEQVFINEEFSELSEEIYKIIAQADQSFNKKYWNDPSSTRVTMNETNPKQEALDILRKAIPLVDKAKYPGPKLLSYHFLAMKFTEYSGRVIGNKGRQAFFIEAAQLINKADQLMPKLINWEQKELSELYCASAEVWRDMTRKAQWGNHAYNKMACDKKVMQQYERALQIDPNNQEALKILKGLKVPKKPIPAMVEEFEKLSDETWNKAQEVRLTMDEEQIYKEPEVNPLMIAEMTLTIQNGSVSIKRSGSDDWETISESHIPLFTGDKIKTSANAKGASITYQNDKAFLSIKNSAEVEICSEVSLMIRRGSVMVQVVKRDGEFVVITPTAVAGVRGTEFEILVADDKSTETYLYEGVVELRNSTDIGYLTAGQKIVVKKNDDKLIQSEFNVSQRKASNWRNLKQQKMKHQQILANNVSKKNRNISPSNNTKRATVGTGKIPYPLPNAKWIEQNTIDGYYVTSSISSSGKEENVYVTGSISSSQYTPNIHHIYYHQKSRRSHSMGSNAHSIFTLDQKHIWICGSRGGIAFNENRGLDAFWKKQNSGTTLDLNDIYFIDEKNGWCVGNNGVVLNTKDGGNNWNIKSGFTRKHLVGVQFVGNNNGWILYNGTYYPSEMPLIYYTKDGGNSWNSTEVAAGLTNSRMDINAMWFIDQNNGWIVGANNLIMFTKDGGISWDYYQKAKEGGLDLKDIQFTDPWNGWICGEKGLLLHTIDGGKTWKKEFIDETDTFTGLRFNGPYIGWVVTNKKIYQYRDEEKYYQYRLKFINREWDTWSDNNTVKISSTNNNIKVKPKITKSPNKTLKKPIFENVTISASPDKKYHEVLVSNSIDYQYIAIVARCPVNVSEKTALTVNWYFNDLPQPITVGNYEVLPEASQYDATIFSYDRPLNPGIYKVEFIMNSNVIGRSEISIQPQESYGEQEAKKYYIEAVKGMDMALQFLNGGDYAHAGEMARSSLPVLQSVLYNSQNLPDVLAVLQAAQTVNGLDKVNNLLQQNNSSEALKWAKVCLATVSSAHQNCKDYQFKQTLANLKKVVEEIVFELNKL